MAVSIYPVVCVHSCCLLGTQHYCLCSNGQYIHRLTNSRSLPLVVHTNSSVVTNDSDKANAFNQYFYSVFKQDTFTLHNSESLSSTCDCICSIDISIKDVFNALINLEPNKAFGLDNIGPSILRNSASVLSAPLQYLFSLSLSRGIIPNEWKIHTIIPVFKSGDKSSVKNYRPIPLLNHVSKVWNVLCITK